jgi:hypothetical protein
MPQIFAQLVNDFTLIDSTGRPSEKFLHKANYLEGFSTLTHPVIIMWWTHPKKMENPVDDSSICLNQVNCSLPCPVYGSYSTANENTPLSFIPAVHPGPGRIRVFGQSGKVSTTRMRSHSLQHSVTFKRKPDSLQTMISSNWAQFDRRVERLSELGLWYRFSGSNCISQDPVRPSRPGAHPKPKPPEVASREAALQALGVPIRGQTTTLSIQRLRGLFP